MYLSLCLCFGLCICLCVCSCFVFISSDTVSRKIKIKPNLNGLHWCKAKGFSLRRIYLTTILIKTSNNLKSVFGVCVVRSFFLLFFFCFDCFLFDKQSTMDGIENLCPCIFKNTYHFPWMLSSL